MYMYISLVVLRNNYPFHILHFGHIVHVCTVHLYDDKYVQCYDTLYVYSYMDTCKCTCITHTHNIYEMIFVLVFNLIQVLVHVYPPQSALGWDHQEQLSKHESQTDASKGFGGKYGVQKESQDKVELSAYSDTCK